VSCGDQSYSDPYTPGYAQDPAVLAQVTTQLGSMSLTDKANQMRGTSFGNPALPQYGDTFRTLDTTNIRGFKFRDGPRGLNLAAPFENGSPGKYSTVFPVAMARGASFDLDLELKVGQAIGDETLAAAQTLMLAPTINLLRHPAWGRAQETYGEDPYLLGRLGSAFVVGTQQYIPACAKHYAANNIENGRGNANAQIDEQTLREIYARHFEMVIKDGGVACVMASYNLVNGKHATQNAHLLNDILRTDFGFKGFVMSDWWAMPNGQNAGADPNLLKSTAAEAVKAGMDMELPWALNYGQLESITGSGLPLALTDINQSASRILEQKLRFNVGLKTGGLGLKAPTTTYANGSIGNDAAHIELAYQAALKGMVLLKNSNSTLPIQRTKYTKIAVIGANVSFTVSDGANPYGGQINFASDIITGDLGSSRAFSDPAKSVGPLAGIQAAAGSGITVVTGSSAAAVGDAGFVVVVAGLTPQDEGEEYTAAGDRANFSLDGKTGGTLQNALISSVAALGKPMVVVLEGGSVIDMPWLDQVPAVVMAWYPGMVGGRALGQLLFGDAVFSGKLPFTWPTGWSQEPTFDSGTTTAMGYDVGYRYFDRNGLTPLYPFGHGLSYTTFEYKRVQLGCTDVTKNGVVDVQVNVANTGTVAADETLFVFVSYPNTTAHRPIKELKGFARVSLTPAQEKQVTIPLRISDLKYFSQTTNSWLVETGDILIKVGPSSANLPLEATLPVR
jgi:beta-glucosidase